MLKWTDKTICFYYRNAVFSFTLGFLLVYYFSVCLYSCVHTYLTFDTDFWVAVTPHFFVTQRIGTWLLTPSNTAILLFWGNQTLLTDTLMVAWWAQEFSSLFLSFFFYCHRLFSINGVCTKCGYLSCPRGYFGSKLIIWKYSLIFKLLSCQEVRIYVVFLQLFFLWFWSLSWHCVLVVNSFLFRDSE